MITREKSGKFQMDFRVNVPNSKLTPNLVLSNLRVGPRIQRREGGLFIGDSMDDYLLRRKQCNPPIWDKKRRKILSHIYSNQVYNQRRLGRQAPAYSRSQLISRYLDDKRFLRLVNEWIKSGCMTHKKPTVDRIDCRESYTMRNIHILTWEENQFKHLLEAKYFHPNCKSVAAYKGGVFIKAYRTRGEASRVLGLNQSGICSAVIGRQKTCGGFEWRNYNATNA